MNSKQLVLAFLVLTPVVAAGMITVACSDDPVAATPAKDAAPEAEVQADTSTPAASITGSVTYAGTKTGVGVYVSAFKMFPPQGPPEAATRLQPTFPGTYTLKGLSSGLYFVSGYLSTGNDHAMGPVAGDPTSRPYMITVTAGQANPLDIVLLDAVVDAGGDANDGGDGGDGG